MLFSSWHTLILAAALVPAVGFAADPTPPNFRLGDAVRPTRYDATLKLIPEQSNFSGTITIGLQVRETVPVIWLNAVNLKVERAVLLGTGANRPLRVVPGGTDFVGFVPASGSVPAGAVKLQIDYQGELNGKASHGLFKNSQDGNSYIYTQFEPIDARRAFPCFDEPGFKVPWQVTVQAKKEHKVFSNTPQTSDTDGPEGLHTVSFAETKPVPSYLVAIAVGPFDVVDAGTAGSRKVPVRIIVPKGRAEDARYAAQVTPQILNELEKYFGIPYPYEKADSLAVPLLGGAMENPGLVTYDQRLILIEPAKTTAARQRSYASVCAHELGHQWFGDLVTMAWWNDTWLNEGFATWTASKILEQWKPEWNESVENVSSRLTVEREDSLISARKVRQPVESANDIVNAFDGITYQKGGAVIRMFETWMGPDKFRQGVQHYLREYSFRNARAEDFFSALASAGGPSIPPAFNSFVDQAGVPQLSVSLRCERGQAPVLTLAQQRALPLGSPGSEPQVWKVPVCVEYASGGKRQRDCQLMTAPAAEMKLSTQSCPDWVLPNARSSGYYLVNYQGDLLARLFRDDGPRLDAAERLGVLGDVTNLVQNGTLPARDFLALVPRLRSDPSRLVTVRLISTLHGLWDDVPAEQQENYHRFVEKMFGERARQLGWRAKAGEDDETRLLRPVLLRFVATEGMDQQLIAEAKSLALRYLEDRSAITPDVVSAVLSTAAHFGDRALFDRLLAEAKKTKDFREQSLLLGALSSFRDPALAQAGLQLLLTDDFDPRNSLFPLLAGAFNDPSTQSLPYEFVKNNFDALAARLSGSLTVDQGALLPKAATPACSEQERAGVEAFLKDKIGRFKGGPRELAQVLEGIQICAAVRKVQQPELAEFLKAY